MADPPTGKEKGATEATEFWEQALGSPDNNKERKERVRSLCRGRLTPYTHGASSTHLVVGVHRYGGDVTRAMGAQG